MSTHQRKGYTNSKGTRVKPTTVRTSGSTSPTAKGQADRLRAQAGGDASPTSPLRDPDRLASRRTTLEREEEYERARHLAARQSLEDTSREALFGHEDVQTRGIFAKRPDLRLSEQVALALDPSPHVRGELARNSSPLDAEVFEALAADPDLSVVREVVKRKDLTFDQANALHDRYRHLPLRPGYRHSQVVTTGWPTQFSRAAWRDENVVASLVWSHPLVTFDRLERHVDHPDIGPSGIESVLYDIPDGVGALLARPSCPPELLCQYATSPNPVERAEVAAHAPLLPPDIDALLAADPSHVVVRAYNSRPDRGSRSELV